MELDFSEQIKQLGLSADKNKTAESSKESDSFTQEELEAQKIEKSQKVPPSSEVEDEEGEDEEEEMDDEEEDSEEEDSEEDEEEMDSSKMKKVKAFLLKKVSKHNENFDQKLSIDQVLKVYRRGLEQASRVFKPGKTEDEWAFARVALFFKMAANQKVKASYIKADSDILNSEEIEENYDFCDFQDIEFQLAKLNCIEAGITQLEMQQAKEEGKKKALNKPFRLPSGSKKKFGVYVKNDKGNVVMVKFGDPNMEIKRDDPERRKNYRARHNCESPGPKWKANYWSCKMWSAKPVSKIAGSDGGCGCDCGGECEPKEELEAGKKGLWDNIREKKKRMGKNYKPAKPGDKDRPDKEAWKKAQADEYEWDGEQEFDQQDLLKENPSLAFVEIIEE
jgi:hypothetical protein